MNDVTMNVFVAEKTGGPEQLELISERFNGEMDEHSVLVANEYIGVNNVDVQRRKGLYKNKFPLILGVDGVGIVQKQGHKVHDFPKGTRVAYCSLPAGGYADLSIIRQEYLIKVPDDMSSSDVIAFLYPGMMADYLLNHVFSSPQGIHKTILVQDSSSCVSQMLIQMALRRNYKCIGTVASDGLLQNRSLRMCTKVFNYNDPDCLKKIMETTEGLGVNLAYDPVGGSICSNMSIRALCNLGGYANYGYLSGLIPSFSMNILHSRSTVISSVSPLHYIRLPHLLRLAAANLFVQVRNGVLSLPKIDKVYAFDEIRLAHEDLEQSSESSNIKVVRL